MNIFTKFQKDWTTFLNFLLSVKFWACLLFFIQTLQCKFLQQHYKSCLYTIVLFFSWFFTASSVLAILGSSEVYFQGKYLPLWIIFDPVHCRHVIKAPPTAFLVALVVLTRPKAESAEVEEQRKALQDNDDKVVGASLVQHLLLPGFQTQVKQICNYSIELSPIIRCI